MAVATLQGSAWCERAACYATHREHDYDSWAALRNVRFWEASHPQGQISHEQTRGKSAEEGVADFPCGRRWFSLRWPGIEAVSVPVGLVETRDQAIYDM